MNANTVNQALGTGAVHLPPGGGEDAAQHIRQLPGWACPWLIG